MIWIEKASLAFRLEKAASQRVPTAQRVTVWSSKQATEPMEWKRALALFKVGATTADRPLPSSRTR